MAESNYRSVQVLGVNGTQVVFRDLGSDGASQVVAADLVKTPMDPAVRLMSVMAR